MYRFPGVKYKISHKNGFELKCTIYITYLLYENNTYINFVFVIFLFSILRWANVVPTI